MVGEDLGIRPRVLDSGQPEFPVTEPISCFTKADSMMAHVSDRHTCCRLQGWDHLEEREAPLDRPCVSPQGGALLAAAFALKHATSLRSLKDNKQGEIHFSVILQISPRLYNTKQKPPSKSMGNLKGGGFSCDFRFSVDGEGEAACCTELSSWVPCSLCWQGRGGGGGASRSQGSGTGFLSSSP